MISHGITQKVKESRIARQMTKDGYVPQLGATHSWFFPKTYFWFYPVDGEVNRFVVGGGYRRSNEVASTYETDAEGVERAWNLQKSR